MKKIFLSVILLVTSNSFCGPNIKKVKKLFKEGCVLVERNQQIKAIKKFNKALEIMPTEPDLWYMRACAYFAMHEYVSAISDFTKAISFAPNAAVIYLRRGLAYNVIGNELAMRNDMIIAAKLGDPNAQKVVAAFVAKEEQFKANLAKRKQDMAASLKARFGGDFSQYMK